MKAYVIITGVIFALITIAHVVRMAIQPHLLTEPVYLFLSLLSAVLTIWAAIVLWRLNR